MKRITACCLLLMICLTGLGLADSQEAAPGIWETIGTESITEAPTMAPQPTATPSPDAFRFRNGIRWGMNPQQVRALENAQMTERVMQDWAVMVTTEKASVSRFTADLVFMFRQDRLQMITYEFQRNDAESVFQYLNGALSSIYGERTDADPSEIKVLMDAVYPGRYKTELLRNGSRWILTDGTAVFEYYYGPEAFAIMYVSPELGGGVYQTDGL